MRQLVSLLSVNFPLPGLCALSIIQEQTLAHPHLQHRKMGSVQYPSPKYGGVGRVVPEDQERVDAKGKRIQEFGLSSDWRGRERL